MTHKELVLATVQALHEEEQTEISVAKVTKIVSVACRVAVAELLGGGDISLPHLGKLKAEHAAPRTARNPQTGAEIHIPARIRVVFRPCKELKEALKP